MFHTLQKNSAKGLNSCGGKVNANGAYVNTKSGSEKKVNVEQKKRSYVVV